MKFNENDERNEVHFELLQYLATEKVEIDLQTIYVIDLNNSYTYIRSNAAMHILSHTKYPWKLFYVFKIIPAWMRDPFYKLVAKNRYKIFGKKEEDWGCG